MSMPYSPHKAMNGYYSRMWKRMKAEIITGYGFKESTVTKITRSRYNPVEQNVVMRFESGMILTFPASATKDDIKIIIAQLEVLKMSCKK